MVFIRPLIIGADGDLERFSTRQYQRMRDAQQSTWSEDALGEAGDWRVLPPLEDFLVNEPLPLPQNMDMLMRLDRARRDAEPTS
jgi:hypothetical protein